MASIRLIPPSLLVVAAFSRHPEALAWAEDHLSPVYGPVAFRSPDFSFHHTRYYEKEMGPFLRKRFLVFERLLASDSLPELKHFSNLLESRLTQENRFPEPRPLNLDPGLLQQGKFLLATTKDMNHRIYLRDGIFAEVTLRYEDGQYHPWPWTYADYREPPLLEFLNQARDFFRTQLTSPGAQAPE